ncbi:sensor histidine kinase [Agromyces larvae]|uniref:histidine kinase n=1 Tax=Agromyces larvae TaxID=2929802 RepID=A0ABY4BWJ0_9MICO|nr:histidine kinase [Agromyces larvae]UOE43598.1 histidine kinase [Agromyces larvae]
MTACATAAFVLFGALALPLLAAAEAGSDDPSTVTPAQPGWWAVVVLGLAQAGAMLWVRRFPRAVLLLVALVPVIHALVVPGATFSLTTAAVVVAVAWAVMLLPLGRSAVVVPVAGLLVAVAQWGNEVRSGAVPDPASMIATSGALLQGLVAVAIGVVIGLFLRAQRAARIAREHEVQALARERDALAREREALVEAAVSRERVAMSRELHDIAAHHMSGIALSAAAISRQVDVDPEAAKLAAQQVRAQSTRALDDLRRVIGLLRDEPGGTRSVETLAAVRELVELRRTTGIEVEFVLHTAEHDAVTEHDLGAGVGPLAQLVAYRMVQESLANAAVHAPGAHCVVEIDDRRPDRLMVLVENDGSHAPDPGPGGGFGLVGMRERADLVDAELHYGATPGGGWQVRLTLRREAILEDVTEGPA